LKDFHLCLSFMCFITRGKPYKKLPNYAFMEQDWQQKYQEFQQLQQQIEQISQQLQMFGQQAAEIDNTKDALLEFENLQNGSEMLSQIANGIFVKSELLDKEKLIVNVGGNVTVEKTIPEMVDLFEKQKVEITSQIAQGELHLQSLQDQAMKIFEEVQAADVQ
jgi:prefoldin alpha subunit